MFKFGEVITQSFVFNIVHQTFVFNMSFASIFILYFLDLSFIYFTHYSHHGSHDDGQDFCKTTCALD